MACRKTPRLMVILIILAVAIVITNGQQPLTPDTENKCGGCPCNNPCVLPPPPPPPPAPKPPPPPSGPNCPPPPYTPKTPSYPTPPSQYIYFTGPPGSLYPIDQNFNGAACRSFTVGLPLLIIGSLLLAMW